MNELLSKFIIQGASGVVLKGTTLVSCSETGRCLSIPYGITGLKKGCLSGINTLEYISLPSTISFVESGCLANCKALKIIRLPKNLVRFSDSLKSATNARVVLYVSFNESTDRFFQCPRYK